MADKQHEADGYHGRATATLTNSSTQSIVEQALGSIPAPDGSRVSPRPTRPAAGWRDQIETSTTITEPETPDVTAAQQPTEQDITTLTEDQPVAVAVPDDFDDTDLFAGAAEPAPVASQPAERVDPVAAELPLADAAPTAEPSTALNQSEEQATLTSVQIPAVDSPAVQAQPHDRATAPTTPPITAAADEPVAADTSLTAAGEFTDVAADPATVPPAVAFAADPAPAVLDDPAHDFGPLLAPTKDRSRRGRTGTGPSKVRRRGWTVLKIAAGLVAATVLIGAGASLFGSSSPGSNEQQAVGAAGSVDTVDFNGMRLPISATAGPRQLNEVTASGFSPDAFGAALAAAHLSVRLDPAAGATVFSSVLDSHVVGDRDRLARAIAAQYATEATELGITDGGALPASPGQLRGYRIEGDPAQGRVTVHLAVDSGQGGTDFAVPLTWSEGDWRINAPASGPFFTVSDLIGDYTNFQ